MFLERIVPILISIETTVIHPDAILFQITLFITGPKQTDGDLEHVVETCWPCIGNRSRNMEILESGSKRGCRAAPVLSPLSVETVQSGARLMMN